MGWRHDRACSCLLVPRHGHGLSRACSHAQPASFGQ
ncbi:hypothetical protein BVRB_2g037110 [Beta vulgaris subsp. vulgaris]|nr:hypothetical protein BVRB_2g037110 [Beta vulgaris subsp. vulgaris]